MKAIKICKAALLCTVALFLGSCADDINVEKSVNGTPTNISVSIHQDWDDDEGTRASRLKESIYSGPRQAVKFNGTIGGQEVVLWADEVDGISESLSAIATESSDEATRGTLMTAVGAGEFSDDMTMFHQDFRLFHNVYSYPDGVKVFRSGNYNQWTISPSNSINFSEYTYLLDAIAPYNAICTRSYSSSNIYWNYESPAKAVDQSDLMLAHATVRGADEKWTIPFKHALSAIRFKMGSKGFNGGYTIKNIAIKNAYTKGQVSTANIQWSSLSNTHDVDQDFNFPITSTSYNQMITNDGDATTTGTTFLMIPTGNGTNPAGRQITVVLTLENSEGQQYTIEASTRAAWRAGYTYTYTIDSELDNSSFQLGVTGNPIFNFKGITFNGGSTWSWSGGSHTVSNSASGGSSGYFGVYSYRTTSTGARVDVPWIVAKYEYSDDDGKTWTETDNGGKEKPTWLTHITREGYHGTVQGISNSVNVSGTDVIDMAAERNAKFKTTPVTDYDLSTHDIKGNDTPMNTANCYVISAPGSYKIPLVYGNAYKDGQPNPSAYNSTLDWNCWFAAASQNSKDDQFSHGRLRDSLAYDYENPFVDYSGAAIVNPWLTVNGANGTPSTAVVLWTDGTSAIPTEPGISSDGKYLTFKVTESNLRSGNSLIAVTDENNRAMWSWHLWFAPDDVLDVTEVTNYQGVKYNFTKETLGYRYSGGRRSSFSKTRKIRLTIQQTECAPGDTPLKGYVIITQHPGEEATDMATTLYQWGRKDPQPGTDTFFPTSGYHYQRLGRGGGSYQGSILGPHHFFRSPIWYYATETSGGYTYWVPEPNQYAGWLSDKDYYNAWSANNNSMVVNDDPVVKTVYDPCPVGFHVPPPNAFTGFMLNYNGTTGTGVNARGGFLSGYTFYAYGAEGATEEERTSSATLYFPASGMRNSPYYNNYDTNAQANMLGVGTTAAYATNTMSPPSYRSQTYPESSVRDYPFTYGRTITFLINGSISSVPGSYTFAVRPVAD